jgi:type I restriction enzyme, S subunit
MPTKLPKGWSTAKLADVCLPVAHIQPSDFPERDFTYIDIGAIDNQRNVIGETKTVTGQDAPSRARQFVQKDDVLFSTVRTYLRHVARIEAEYANAIAFTGFAVIRAAEGVRPQFLFYQLISAEFLAALNPLQTGTSYPAVRARV